MNPARYLYVGADRPTTYPQLAERMGVAERQAMQAVRDARLAGVAIISGGRGLWIATGAQEARRAASALRSRAIHQMETAQALERAAERMEQSTLWDSAA